MKALLLAGADVNISARDSTHIYNRVNSAAGATAAQTPKTSVADYLQTNQNKLYTQDMKHGGSPLHWSASREVLDALVACDCDVNALNFNQQTALHVMVSRNRLDCVVSLLSHEAEVDVRDKDGNTPLHIAMEKKNIAIVQALVVFGCDINLPNKDGKTPRHFVGKDMSGTNDDMILYVLHSVSEASLLRAPF